MSTGIGIYVEPHTNNIGIGITAPTKKLHVVGDTRLEGNLTVNGTQTIINTDVITTEQIVATNAGTGPALIVTQTGDHPIAEFIDDSTTVMKIVNGGNVGMGTADPQQRLHVQGSILATTQHLGPTADTSNAPGFSWSGDADTGIYRPAANAVGVVTGGLERMRVLDNGNVGIGTTNPQQALHIQGNILSSGSTSAGTQFLGLATDGVTAPSYSWTDDSNTGMYHPGADKLGLVTAGVERMSVLANGYVGIGTTNPLQKLHIEGNTRINGSDGTIINLTPAAGASGMIRVDMTAAGGTSLVTTGGGTNLQVHQANGNIRIFSSAGSTASDITFGVTPTGEMLGNVGIGTTNPQAKLHVNGDLKVSRLGTGFNSLTVAFNAVYDGPAQIFGVIYTSSTDGHWPVNMTFGTGTTSVTTDIFSYRIYDGSPYQQFPLNTYVPAGYWVKFMNPYNKTSLSLGGYVVKC